MSKGRARRCAQQQRCPALCPYYRRPVSSRPNGGLRSACGLTNSAAKYAIRGWNPPPGRGTWVAATLLWSAAAQEQPHGASAGETGLSCEAL